MSTSQNKDHLYILILNQLSYLIVSFWSYSVVILYPFFKIGNEHTTLWPSTRHSRWNILIYRSMVFVPFDGSFKIVETNARKVNQNCELRRSNGETLFHRSDLLIASTDTCTVHICSSTIDFSQKTYNTQCFDDFWFQSQYVPNRPWNLLSKQKPSK